jgi:hypothetical protein
MSTIDFGIPDWGKEVFLPWTAAAEGELIYSWKQFGMIEVMMRIWDSDHVRGNRNIWRQFKRKSSGLPKLELVFADYEGRGQAIPWDGMRKGSWMYSKAVADWRGLHCTRTGRNIQSNLDITLYENTWNIGYGEGLIVRELSGTLVMEGTRLYENRLEHFEPGENCMVQEIPKQWRARVGELNVSAPLGTLKAGETPGTHRAPFQGWIDNCIATKASQTKDKKDRNTVK